MRNKQVDYELEHKKIVAKQARETLCRSLSIAESFAKDGDFEAATEYMVQAMADLVKAKREKERVEEHGQ